MPVEEESVQLNGAIKKTGLRYKLISFESRNKVENWELKQIFKGIKKDSKLYERKNPDGLEKYLINSLRS